MKEQKRVSVRDHKSRNKFCDRMDRIFGCRGAYLCNISCPFYLWYEVVLLMDSKNLPLGEAFRLSLRASIGKGERQEIFRDTLENKGKDYPPIGWQEKVK